jgi:TfoX/Sxy family transcriptional regulator of competence genes
MACDEQLVLRMRDALQGVAGVGERRMFGGVCFTLNGNMCCGVVKDEIMVRVGPEKYSSALEHPHAREMDFTGRTMQGYVFVAKPGFESDASLRAWIDKARLFVGALSAKARKLEPKPSLARLARRPMNMPKPKQS